MPVVYEKKTGKKLWFQFPIDARELVDSGDYTFAAPENVQQENVDMDGAKLKEVSDISERARLGVVLQEGERETLNQYQSALEAEVPAGSSPVPAPEPSVTTDVFNPATAERPALFAYLRDKDIDVGNAASTQTLRERVYESMNEGKSQSDSEE